MAVRAQCPRCKQSLSVPNKLAGSYVSCPRCQGRFWVSKDSPTDPSVSDSVNLPASSTPTMAPAATAAPAAASPPLAVPPIRPLPIPMPAMPNSGPHSGSASVGPATSTVASPSVQAPISQRPIAPTVMPIPPAVPPLTSAIAGVNGPKSQPPSAQAGSSRNSGAAPPARNRLRRRKPARSRGWSRRRPRNRH